MAFHWQSCDGLLLAELLPGEEKAFLPPAGSTQVESLPAGDARDISLCSGLY